MKTLHLIVGQKHRSPEERQALKKLPNRSALRLIREPGNKFDRNAVQVWTDVADGSPPAHVGYLRAGDAEVVAKMMDARGMTEAPAIYAGSNSDWAELDL